MKYRFILTYQATDSETTDTRTCFPLHGDDLIINIDREQGEWYYTRNLDGKLVFERDDYDWIMGCEFDGTFTLDIKESHDNGANWYDYFTGTFSRASLEIDQDNHQATLNGLKEGVEDLIKNGKSEDYDLMKLIPDSYAKEVQGQVPPALALVDYRSTSINKSDVFCGGPATAGGYDSKHTDSGYNENNKIESDDDWNFVGIYAEAKVKMKSSHADADGLYAGVLQYSTRWTDYFFPVGTLTNQNGSRIVIDAYVERDDEPPFSPISYRRIRIFDANNNEVDEELARLIAAKQSPSSVEYDYTDVPQHWLDKLTIYFHYIRATLLTQSGGNAVIILDTGDYYKRMAAFQGSGLTVTITANTSDQPNGHRMVPGSDEYGGTPQYFAPPNTTQNWIPLAEDNWNFASMWYTITPSVTNGLDDPAKAGTFRWTRCWTIGTCIQFLLQRITDGKVVFAENTDYSQFLYGNPNPVEGNEPFQWLVTQKSNVMRPAASGAARCPVRLDWFFELLRNAFNCYYWFEKRNDGRYDFRIEHVEYFRRGGTYTPNTQDDPPLDLTRLKPYRNFLRNGQPAKRYADQTNKYTFDLDGMVEKYTYSWQGDGGGDDFKGNPMYFRAGWIEKGSSEDHQVDNIFADLGWLMLNAGTDTASSKNYDGLFIFGGYNPYTAIEWKENSKPTEQYMTLLQGSGFRVNIDIWLNAPVGQIVRAELLEEGSFLPMIPSSITGTGSPQMLNVTVVAPQQFTNYTLRINFGANYADVTIHRIHTTEGNVFRVPNVRNLLRDDDSKLQNGCLAWPWLQVEYLHYDIPAAKWTYLKDEYTDNPAREWESDGTIKMVKKQTVGVVPIPDKGTEDAIIGIMGVKTGLGTGIIDNAKINLSSRNAEMTIIYDINPNNN